MTEKILILDFGGQYTQLIARAVREANVYCEIIPFHQDIVYDEYLKGIILSGSPFSVNEKNAPDVDITTMQKKLPVLGICYGAQLAAKKFGGEVAKSNKREYGRALMRKKQEDVLLKDVMDLSQVWMSHSDTILAMPSGFEVLATTEDIPFAAFKRNGTGHPVYGVQFHPEVYHSIEGKKILKNFLVNICGCKQDWTPAHFITDTVNNLKKVIGDRKVIMALSGGVDSTVAATLIHRAIGDRLSGIFVDNGVLRKNEFGEVLETYKKIGLNVKGVDAKDIFYRELQGKTDPEAKRKTIGKLFIDIFQEEAKSIKGIFLADEVLKFTPRREYMRLFILEYLIALRIMRRNLFIGYVMAVKILLHFRRYDLIHFLFVSRWRRTCFAIRNFAVGRNHHFTHVVACLRSRNSRDKKVGDLVGAVICR